MTTLNTKQLSALAEASPAEFINEFEKARSLRNARRRRLYNQNANGVRDKAHTLNRQYRETHAEAERERARRYAEQKKALVQKYRELTQEAA